MLKKTIKYTNLDGDEVEEDFYFHMSKMEVAKLELEHGDGGFSGHLRRVLETQDPKTIIGAFEHFLSISYGVRSEDGKRFTKSPELTEEFKETEAYSQLFYELVTNSMNGAEFIKGVLPADMTKNIDEKQIALLTAGGEISEPEKKPLDQWTEAELRELPKEEFIRLVGDNPRVMTKAQLVIAMQHKTSE